MDDTAGPSLENEEEPRFKVVLLGEGAVGKSSLMLRYVENKFNPRHISTIQASFATKKLNIDGKQVELNIWDTAGQEKFHALGPIYYRDSQGALLIYDITDQKSFERVKNWVKELQRMLGDTVVLFIVGNKVDLNEQRTVASGEAYAYAESVKAEYRETSAKEDVGVIPLFEDLVKSMSQKSKERSFEAQTTTLRRHGSRRSIRIVEDQPTPSRKCC